MTAAVTITGVTVTCYTNNAVHLWLRWTNIVPQKHIIAREQRGGLVNTYIDQCFVAFHDIEQNEPGDTWTHTFTCEPWPGCETRWFYFWGTVAGVLSPSASCILEYHRPFILVLYPWETPGSPTCDGFADRYIDLQTWSQIHDGPGTAGNKTSSVIWVNLWTSATANKYRRSSRAKLTFDTTPIPANAHIVSADLTITPTAMENPIAAPATFAIFTAPAPPFDNVIDADYTGFGSTPLSPPLPFTTFVPYTQVAIPILPDKLSVIKKAALTALGIREAAFDAPNIPLPWAPWSGLTLRFYSILAPIPIQRPHLTITYTTT